MFYNETVTMNQVEEEPPLVFELIREGHYDFVDKLLSKNKISVNVCDEDGNNVLMKLLKVGRYDIVLKHMKNKGITLDEVSEDDAKEF